LILVGTVLAVAVFGAALTPATATSHFEITSEDSQPVPERSVEFRNATYQLDSFVVADPGDEINVSVSGPDEAYRVYIYNSDEQLVDSRATVGNDTFTFDLAEYEPGSYSVTVYQSGDYEALKPLVVQGYDVSVDAPEQITTDEGVSVRVSVERNGTDSGPEAVRAVVSSSEDELAVNATGADGSYTAAVEAGALDSGNYTVYGVVQGETQVFDRNEVSGVSDRVSLSVRNATGTPAGEATATTALTAEPTPTPTASATRPNAGATATPTETVTAEAAAAETAAAESGESAITPTDDSQPETTAGSGPGFSVVVTVVALALAVAVWGRRG
jgi:hypothetical protein